MNGELRNTRRKETQKCISMINMILQVTKICLYYKIQECITIEIQNDGNIKLLNTKTGSLSGKIRTIKI